MGLIDPRAVRTPSQHSSENVWPSTQIYLTHVLGTLQILWINVNFFILCCSTRHLTHRVNYKSPAPQLQERTNQITAVHDPTAQICFHSCAGATFAQLPSPLDKPRAPASLQRPSVRPVLSAARRARDTPPCTVSPRRSPPDEGCKENFIF